MFSVFFHPLFPPPPPAPSLPPLFPHTLRSLLCPAFPQHALLGFSISLSAGLAALEIAGEDLKQRSSWILLMKHLNAQISHNSLPCLMGMGSSQGVLTSRRTRLKHSPWKTNRGSEEGGVNNLVFRWGMPPTSSAQITSISRGFSRLETKNAHSGKSIHFKSIWIKVHLIELAFHGMK